MKIVDLRTGRTLVDKLSASEAREHMHTRIRQACQDSNISEESTTQIIANYERTGFQPFMFEVVK